MKRLFFMPLMAGVLTLSAFVSGCGGGGGGGGGGFTISGTITNWDPTHTLKAYIRDSDYGTVQVDSQKRFNYSLPTPNSGDLTPVEFDSDLIGACGDNATPNITERPTVSPNNVKSNSLDLVAIGPNNTRRDVDLTNPNFNGNNPTPNTPFRGMYLYFDQNASISGNYRYSCPDGVKFNFQFDPQYSQGWNYVEFVFVSYDQQTQTYTIKLTRKSQPDSRLQWRMEEDGGGGTGGGGGGGGSFTLTSQSFQSGGVIPNRYAYNQCNINGAQNVSPHLRWSNPPQGTQSFVIIMDDPDARNFTHWIVYNIPANTTEIPENYSPSPPVGQGINDYGQVGYGGPCPPQGETHRYNFTIYALNSTLSFNNPPDRNQIQQAMQGKILGTATISGTFSR
ncbi:MAG: YbhB/YbcL family Raf kinase inhibitor-like protein [Aquificaceae bacterium]